MKLLRMVADEFNIKKQAEELGLKTWQAPSFLMFLMGVIIAVAIVAVYYVANNYDSLEAFIWSEAAVVSVLFTIGSFIIRSVEEVAKLNKMKSEFVSIASHQLKTPLAQINWEMELLLSKNKNGLRAKQLELLNTIAKSNDRMTRMVNDLLDVARIDQKKLILNPEKIDFVHLVESIIKDNELLAKSNNVEIRLIKSSEGIPPVVVDKRRMKVVVDNLISNAVKYVDKKGYVEITVERKGDQIVMCVKDNGVGIPENQQDKVFEKFFRSNNIARYQTEGTGLGLYITKNIVEQSGGKIDFKSIEGIGSSFRISLPVNQNQHLFFSKIK